MNMPTQPDANRPQGPLRPASVPSIDEMERQLGDALRPVPAPAGLAERILVAARKNTAGKGRRFSASWTRYAMAAALLLSATVSVRFWQERQEELVRQETGRQLTAAFTLTGEKILLSQSKAAGKLKLLLKPLEALPQKGN